MAEHISAGAQWPFKGYGAIEEDCSRQHMTWSSSNQGVWRREVPANPMDVLISQAGTAHSSPDSATEDPELAVMQLQDAVAGPINRSFRTLPDREVTPETLEDAYIQFIWYCNPVLAPTFSTRELRKGFLSVPRADGKIFETFNLFELVKKLESGEIGTWNYLVLELGVERPDPSKGQSNQKLGQYAVRLKKWMHAHHIDAFFQYLLGRPNDYYTNIPTDPESAFSTPRDNVPPEDDLALRALVPSFRPKRGRRREQDADEDSASAKHARAENAASTAVEDNEQSQSTTLQDVMSAAIDSPHPSAQSTGPQESKKPKLRIPYPQSAIPSYDYNAHMNEVWASAERAFLGPQASTPSQSQPTHMPWGGSSQWPYPRSAIDPQPPPNPFSLQDGSQSAHPLTHKGTPRKRPGSSVSAAWNSGSPPGKSGKGRGRPGRPPVSRVFQNGPYSAFKTNKKDRSARQSEELASSPVIDLTPDPAQPPLTPRPASTQKPSKLSLQVPQQPAGNVRLATPPPKVLLNGGGDAGQNSNGEEPESQRRSSADFFNIIDEESDVDNDELGEGDERTDWKRRALILQRKLKEAQAELKIVKRKVLEAIM